MPESHEGRFVTKGVEGDEIVITGMSGRFPESENLQELWENLLSKTDMIKVDGELSGAVPSSIRSSLSFSIPHFSFLSLSGGATPSERQTALSLT